MKISINGLKQILNTTATIEEISESLTNIGLEVDDVIDYSTGFEKFCVGKVVAAKQHPNADRLRVCEVNIGEAENLQIVCGASNAREGITVAVSKVGAVIPASGLVIKQSSLRDVDSCGMMCSYTELGLPYNKKVDEFDGIIELSNELKAGEKLTTAMFKNDAILDVAITPNRGDCCSLIGIARDLAAYGFATLNTAELLTNNASVQTAKTEEIITNNRKDDVEIYACKIGDVNAFSTVSSPFGSNAALEVAKAGITVQNTVADVAKYAMLITGLPVLTVNANACKNQAKLQIRGAKKGETATIKGEKLTLTEDMIVVAGEKIVAVIGIDVVDEFLPTNNNENSDEIIAMILNVSPEIASKTGQLLKTTTDCRFRSERGLDREMADKAMSFFVNSVQKCHAKANVICKQNEINVAKETGGASNAAVPSFAATKQISYDVKLFERVVGFAVEESEAERHLIALGFGVKKEGGKLQLTVPSYRNDITIAAQVTSELIRMIGFDKMPEAELSVDSSKFTENKNKESRIKHKMHNEIRRTLCSSGYKEIVTFSFTDVKNIGYMQGAASSANANAVKSTIANPLTLSQNAMRESLLPHMTAALIENLNKYKVDTLSLLEIGSVFGGHVGGAAHTQSQCASGIRYGLKTFGDVCGNAKEEEKPFDIFDVKSDALTALAIAGVNVSSLTVEQREGVKNTEAYFAVCLNGEEVAEFGVLKKDFANLTRAQKSKLSHNICFFNVMLSKIEVSQFKSVSKIGTKDKIGNLQKDIAFTFAKSVLNNNDGKSGNKKWSIAQIISDISASSNFIESVSIGDIYPSPDSEKFKEAEEFSVMFSLTIMQESASEASGDEMMEMFKSIEKMVTSSYSGTLRGSL